MKVGRSLDSDLCGIPEGKYTANQSKHGRRNQRPLSLLRIHVHVFSATKLEFSNQIFRFQRICRDKHNSTYLLL